MLPQLEIIITLLWAGMILGISFLESWAKFQAPSLSKAIGLDVGRTVFTFFHKAQCALLIILILINLFAKVTFINDLPLGILTAVFALQLAWVFPILNQRVNVILSGGNPPHSHAHTIYGLFEVAKFLVLIFMSARLIF